MKKSLFAVLILLLCTTTAFAASFAPTLLKLSVASPVQYEFDGTTLSIPVTVTGTPAMTWFFIYTKDKAASIGPIQNGYLGWHYVNKVDTCIYMSEAMEFTKGSNTIKWDGKNNYEQMVPAGEYTYYLWAYDGSSPKVRMSKFFYGYYHTLDIQERDTQGMPLANPVAYSHGFGLKWTLGSDPADSTLEETCALGLPSGWGTGDNWWVDQNDFNYIYQGVKNPDSKIMGITKWKWVPNGAGELQTTFGDNGYATWESNCDSHSPIVVSDKNYLYSADQGYHLTNGESNFYIYDLEGSQITKLDMSKWWNDKNDLDAGGQFNGGPDDHNIKNGKIFLNCHCSCLNQMVDPAAYLSSNVDEDFYLWGNANGDYVLDHNFEETAVHKWVCNDYSVGPYKYNISIDNNLFSAIPCYDMGAVSFGLLGPDGTGVGYLAFQGETAGFKLTNNFVDSGTPFDGLYCDNNSIGGSGVTIWLTEETRGMWFVGHDSVKGILSNQVAVKEAAPAAFVVAQNSPNPFNPTTTISFTLTKAGKTTVAIYNAAGQKVDTLVNSSLTAGAHSVVWNAAKFSAGVYFYTVRSGDFSKTMKMTLLK